MLTEFFEASALDASWWSKKKNGGSLGVSYWDDMMNNVRIEPPTESPKNERFINLSSEKF